MSPITLKLFRFNLTIFIIYRTTPATTKSRKPVPFSDFLTLTYIAAISHREFMIIIDVNIRRDIPNNSQGQQILSALNSTNFTQFVFAPTHWDNHTLDLVITANTSSLSSVIDYSPIFPTYLLYFNYLTTPFCSIV